MSRSPICRSAWMFLWSLLWALAAHGETASSSEHWYQVQLAGEPAGWMVLRELSQDHKITTEAVTHMQVRRAGMALTMEMESRFEETDDGRPLSAMTRQKLGQEPMISRFTFDGENLRIERQQGDEVLQEEAKVPAGDWLTPAGSQRDLRRRLAAGETSFSQLGLDLLTGLEPITNEWRLESPQEKVLVGGRTWTASRWTQTQSFLPGVKSTVDLAADGTLLRSATQLMGLEMIISLSTRDEVLAAEGAPELLVQSFIYPDRTLAAPRRLRRAVYEVTAGEGGELPALPSVGAQRVERKGRAARVTVELGSSPELELSATDRATYLDDSAYVHHSSPEIRRLSEQALAKANSDTAARAETLRAFVASYLTEKDLSAIFSTATETARTRTGDCTEHAVLLTAMLRAAGIPARAVTGVVYVRRFAGASDLFGYHMWTQAWTGERWIDLDATLDSQRFDAAHIAFAVSSLGDQQTALRELASIVPSMGSLTVRILETGQ